MQIGIQRGNLLFATALSWIMIILSVESAQAGEMQNTYTTFDPFEATILELQVAMGTGRLTARELTQFYLTRIERFDQTGPALNAMAFINVDALAIADSLDAERVVSGPRGPLHGIPIVVKDNYETMGMPTTAGSVLLHGFMPEHDAYQVARLKQAGAIILGKTNMHEFAYGITSEGSAFGAVKNPYDPGRNPGGSSGGTGAAVASNFAAAGMGSDTCGSIRIPAAHNNLVGLRGTQGLSSRSGIVPLSHTQDIGGPLARTVVDLALVLDATVGFDPEDPQSAQSTGRVPSSYLSGLAPDALSGRRIGLLEDLLIQDPEDTEVVAVIGQATAELAALGAELVRVRIPDFDQVINGEASGFFVLAHDFKYDINAYLARHPSAPVSSLSEILASGRYHPVIDQVLRLSEAMNEESNAVYQAELAQRQMIREAVLAVMAEQSLDVLAYPSIRRIAAPLREPQDGSNCQLSAKSGMPAISMPAGFTDDGLPVGLELLGKPWSEEMLLAMAYAFEQGAGHRQPPGLLPGGVNVEISEPFTQSDKAIPEAISKLKDQ
jgi:Asp-tRNA(Asn)/Glu-tRNA(Gln) amidotransferase A subunit family amidase